MKQSGIVCAAGLMIAAVWFGGCAPAPRVLLDIERVSAAELVQSIRANHLKKKTLQARGTLSIETRDFANTGRFTMNLKHPDSLLIRLRGPFGIDVGTVFLSQTHFLFYNGVANQVVQGEPRTEVLRAFLRFDIEVDDVMGFFLGGRQSPLYDGKRPDEFSVEGGEYLLVYQTPVSIRRYWVDPIHRTVTRVLYSDRNDLPVIEERYGRFTETNGITMARSIRIISHREHASFSVSYERVDLNVDGLSFDFTIPRNAERIEW